MTVEKIVKVEDLEKEKKELISEKAKELLVTISEVAYDISNERNVPTGEFLRISDQLFILTLSGILSTWVKVHELAWKKYKELSELSKSEK